MQQTFFKIFEYFPWKTSKVVIIQVPENNKAKNIQTKNKTNQNGTERQKRNSVFIIDL